MLISLRAGRKPTLRTYEMICYYFTGLAEDDELLTHFLVSFLKIQERWRSLKPERLSVFEVEKSPAQEIASSKRIFMFNFFVPCRIAVSSTHRIGVAMYAIRVDFRSAHASLESISTVR
jgi:hypothetical protein